MKRLAEALFDALQFLGLLALSEKLEHRIGRLRVLTYHRVARDDEDTDLEPGLNSATPAEFEAQMMLLKQAYCPVSIQTVLHAQRSGEPLPPKAVLVTFDDGYEDFQRNAWPVLKELSIPVVLFVPTDFPDSEGSGFWWDRLHLAVMNSEHDQVNIDDIGHLDLSERRQAYKKLRNHVKSLPHRDAMQWVEKAIAQLGPIPSVQRVLGWDDLRELASEGVAVCAHGKTHALFTRLDQPALKQELLEAKQKLRQELGDLAGPPVLAYPANATSESVRTAAREAGYIMSFGGQRGVNTLPVSDPHEILRLPALRYRMGLFRAQLRPSICRLGNLFMQLKSRAST